MFSGWVKTNFRPKFEMNFREEEFHIHFCYFQWSWQLGYFIWCSRILQNGTFTRLLLTSVKEFTIWFRIWRFVSSKCFVQSFRKLPHLNNHTMMKLNKCLVIVKIISIISLIIFDTSYAALFYVKMEDDEEGTEKNLKILIWC